MKELNMQNIIKLAFFAALCVSTSLWAEPNLKRPDSEISDSEMSDLELPPPAVGWDEQIFLGERLPERKGITQCLLNDIKNHTNEYIQGLKRGDVSIDNVSRTYENEAQFLGHLEAIINQNNGTNMTIQFKDKSYKIMLDHGDDGSVTVIISAI